MRSLVQCIQSSILQDFIKPQYNYLLSTWQSSRAAMTTSRVLGDIRDCSVDIFMSYCLGIIMYNIPALYIWNTWDGTHWVFDTIVVDKSRNYPHSRDINYASPLFKGSWQVCNNSQIILIKLLEYNSLLSQYINLAGKSITKATLVLPFLPTRCGRVGD